jgi:hypothetical protein
MAARAALHVLARAGPPPSGCGRPGVLAAPEALGDPRGAGAAAGRSLPAAPAERTGGLLPSEEGPVRDAEGDHGHRPYARPPELQAPETRYDRRTPAYGRRQTTVPPSDGPECDAPGEGLGLCIRPNTRRHSGRTVTSVEQFLGRSPVVKRPTTPRSGFFPFFPLYVRRRDCRWPRVPTCLPSASADCTGLRHTRMEAHSPSRRRVHRDLRVCCGRETFLSPHTVLRKTEAER